MGAVAEKLEGHSPDNEPSFSERLFRDGPLFRNVAWDAPLRSQLEPKVLLIQYS